MSDKNSESHLTLTDKQDVIARAIVLRIPIKTVANDLKIAPSTVNDHIKALKRKYGVQTTPQLVAALLGEPTVAPPPNWGEIKNRLPERDPFGDELHRDRDGSLMLSDTIAFPFGEPWKPAPEPRVVPEELDGPAATIPRLLEIGKILTGILAAVVLSILAFQAVMGLVDQGVASGP